MHTSFVVTPCKVVRAHTSAVELEQFWKLFQAGKPAPGGDEQVVSADFAQKNPMVAADPSAQERLL